MLLEGSQIDNGPESGMRLQFDLTVRSGFVARI
jgi:hypothetical protein